MTKHKEEKNLSHKNNFDLIRLLAALQVVFRHLFLDYDFGSKPFNLIKEIILSFPGVPVFFTVSGFLVYWSFDRNHNEIKKFYKNRFLRIYPALWFCIIITAITLICYDKEGVILKNLTVFVLWFMGQATFIQFWRPEFLQFWGSGFPNSSLWTITIELQFYLILPLLYRLINFYRHKWIIMSIIFITSVIFNWWISGIDRENVIYKLGAVSIFYYIFYFILGTFFYIYWNKISFLFSGKLFLWTIVYAALYISFKGKIDLNFYNIDTFYKLPYIILLNAVIISFVFSYTGLSKKLLNGNDISYGIYIYHMVIVDFFIHYSISENITNKLLVIAISIVVAYLSWVLIEKRALLLKNKF